MKTIRTYNTIASQGIDILSSHYNVGEDVSDPIAILVRSFDLNNEIIPDSVLVIGRAGAGINNIPVNSMSERGIVILNTPGSNANAVKELVIGALIASYRNIPTAAVYVNNLTSEGASLDKEVESGKKLFVGHEIRGKILGVIGLGAIGGEVAITASLLGMNVIGYDPHATPEQLARLLPEITIVSNIVTLIQQADAITVHVPLLAATKDIVGREMLAHAKKKCVVLNFSRGGVVDDIAVLEAIANGTVYRYVTDFPTRALRGNNAVTALPHLGASTEESEEQSAVMVARQIKEYLDNGNIINSVNMPSIMLERTGKIRVSIIHRNVPDMLGQITHLLGSHSINIESAVNVARNSYAYTLIDINSTPSEDVITGLSAIENVIRVRLF